MQSISDLDKRQRVDPLKDVIVLTYHKLWSEKRKQTRHVLLARNICVCESWHSIRPINKWYEYFHLRKRGKVSLPNKQEKIRCNS